MIIFTNHITKIYKNVKFEEYGFRIGKKKKRVGWKYLIIPVYEKFDAVFHYWDFECLVEDFNFENRFIEGDRVFRDPYITIYLSDGNYERVWFKTEEELDDYVSDLIRTNPTIEIKS
jgi:hypothetical protein